MKRLHKEKWSKALINRSNETAFALEEIRLLRHARDEGNGRIFEQMAEHSKWNNKYFLIRRSQIQGRGAFAIRKIRKGTRIVEYIGERISAKEELRRYNDWGQNRHHTFLFAVNKNTTIDATRFGNEAKYFNHSCDPNCEAIDENGHIFIYAKRTIYPGEELNYDYGFEVTEPLTPKIMKFYHCKCGTSVCRRTILKPKYWRPGVPLKLASRSSNSHPH
jgi:uncharacterized protein